MNLEGHILKNFMAHGKFIYQNNYKKSEKLIEPN